MPLVRPLPASCFPAGVPCQRAWTVALPRGVRLLPTPGSSGTTFGPLVFVRTHDAPPGLLSHEAVHVWQWRRDGWRRFAWRYLSEWLAGMRAGLGARAAYRAISYEQEARRRSARG